MKLTKTDFIQFLQCSKSLWVLKLDPENYPKNNSSPSLGKYKREGDEVEEYVKILFALEQKEGVDFQKVFTTEDGLFARVDAIEKTKEKQTFLYEIKSSTRVKTEKDCNHIKDACFQKICIERSGQPIDGVFIIHLNKDYVRSGKIDPRELLTIVDVTKKVTEIYAKTEAEINEALALLKQKEIDKNGCSCLFKSRGKHCDTFSYFNKLEVPINLSIYSLPGKIDKKRLNLINQGIFDLQKIPENYALSPSHQPILRSAKTGKPKIDLDQIKDFLSNLTFPLHFFDYETFDSAIPFINGISPYKKFPVQYSLHIVDKNGNLTHQEFLEREPQQLDELIQKLLKKMEADFSFEGSVISWNASFEKAQNNEMAKLFPEKANFLNDINQRMVDLQIPFKNAYVDARFEGSTSIKKVLPIVCPDLNHKELAIQDGFSAMEAWFKMVNLDGKEADKIIQDLLGYCRLDTYAMVEIYRFLRGLLK